MNHPKFYDHVVFQSFDHNLFYQLVQMMGMKSCWRLRMLLLIPVLFLLRTYMISCFLKDTGFFTYLVHLIVIADHGISNPFWKQTEPFFGFLTDVDLAYLKQQVMPFIFFLSSLRCISFIPHPLWNHHYFFQPYLLMFS